VSSGVQRVPGTVRYSLGYFLGWQAAAFSAGAAAIHFAEISPHIEEYWLFGAFFFIVAWFQAATVIALVARPSPRLMLLIAVVNLVVIAIWVWSRTAGLPIGPEAGQPEAVGAADVLSTVLEALLVGWVLALLLQGIAARGASRGLGVLTTAIVWAGIVGATALVFFTGPGTMAH
jgi:hypothetical protein